MRRRVQTFLLQLYHGTWGRILLSAVLTAVLLLLFSRVQQIAYLTNDDNAIAFTLAGYHTGAPSPYALFTNCILGYAISGLYSIFPGVAWWAVLQLVLIALSGVTIGAVLLREGAKRQAPLILPLGLHMSFLLLAVLQPFVEPTYTVTGAILGAAGAALILTAADEEKQKTRVLLDFFGLAATVLAFLYREETGFAVLCFFFAAALYRVLLAVKEDLAARRRAVKTAAILLVAAAVLCGGALALNNALHARVNGTEYETFFRYRERFTDYPRPSYADDPALYASVGWDESLYDLADYWCFLDERINSETLSVITAAEEPPVSLVEAARTCLDMIEADVPVRLMGSALLMLFAFGLFSLQRSIRRWPSFALLTALLLGTACLSLFLALRGRFLLRTFRVVAIPALTMCAVLAMRMTAPRADRQGRIGNRLLTALMVLLAAIAGFFCARELRRNSPKQLISDSRAVYAYVMQHPENVYFRDTFVINNVDAFAVYPADKPTNLFSWGGCELRSAESERQFACNGLAMRNAEVFAEDGVYFLTRVDSDEYAVLLRYLSTWRGAKGMELVETVTPDIGVYRVLY